MAKKSKLDEFLTRRTHLKAIEERALAAKKVNIDIDRDMEKTSEREIFTIFSIVCFQLASNPPPATPTATPAQPAVADNKPAASSIANPLNNKALFNALSVKIHALRSHYVALTQMSKTYPCYSSGCAAQKPSECYSPLCRKRCRLRVELLDLLHKASALNQANKENKVIPVVPLPKKVIKPEGSTGVSVLFFI